MLQLKQVNKIYYGNKGIKDINIEIEKGSIVGLLGRNGSGKTTLLKAILSLISIDSGDISWNDASIKQQYEQIAYICESGSFIAYMSANEYGRFLQKYYPTFHIEKYQAILQQFEVEMEPGLRSLSRGQQLKVEIAAGLAMEAKLLILDEPFTTLDVYAKEDTVKMLIEQYAPDKIILISTHNIEEIEQVVDRCIVMDDGKIVEDITMEELEKDKKDIKTLLDQYRPKVKQENN